MIKYCFRRTDVVSYVKSHILDLEPGSRLTITIEPERSEGYYVTIAIAELSDGIPTPNSSKGLDVT